MRSRLLGSCSDPRIRTRAPRFVVVRTKNGRVQVPIQGFFPFGFAQGQNDGVGGTQICGGEGERSALRLRSGSIPYPLQKCAKGRARWGGVGRRRVWLLDTPISKCERPHPIWPRTPAGDPDLQVRETPTPSGQERPLDTPDLGRPARSPTTPAVDAIA